MRWPMREAFEAALHGLRREALEAYRHDELLWALLAPHSKKPPKAPELPKILKN